MANEVISSIFEGINLIRTDIRSKSSQHEETIDCKKFFLDPFVHTLTEQHDLFQEVYELLEDKKSKEIYLQDIKRRILYSYFSIFTADEFVNTQYTAQKHRRDIIEYKANPNSKHFNFIANDIQTFILNAYLDADIYSLHSDDVVFDIGSYNGATACNFSKFVSDGLVYTFEPEGTLFESVKKNTSNYGNIIPENLGFSNSEREAFFSICGGVSSISDDGESKVQLKTIDNYVREKNISKLTLIKMDIEGEELNALRGAIHTLKTLKPKLAICMYHNHGEDLLTVPLFIKNLEIYNKFYIRKYHISDQETVFFAV